MISDNAYYQIQYWMISRLKLKGLKLQLYAIIYGFSQQNQGCFYGTLNYLSEFTGYEATRISKGLKELCKEGLLERRVLKDLENRVAYRVLTKSQDSLDKKSRPPLTKSQDPLDKKSNNNIDYNTNINNNIYTGKLQSNLPADGEISKEKKNKNDDAFGEIFEAYQSFLFRNLNKTTKIRIESDYVQWSLKKILKLYNDLKPKESIFEFAYSIITANYVRLEFKEGMPDEHLRISIETAARHASTNYDFFIDRQLTIKPEQARKLWRERGDGA